MKNSKYLIARIIELAKPMHYADGKLMGYAVNKFSLSEEELNLLKKEIGLEANNENTRSKASGI